MGKGRCGHMTYGPTVLRRAPGFLGFALHGIQHTIKSQCRTNQICADTERANRVAEGKQRRALRKLLEVIMEDEKKRKEAEEGGEMEGEHEGYWCGCPEKWKWNALSGRLEERRGGICGCQDREVQMMEDVRGSEKEVDSGCDVV